MKRSEALKYIENILIYKIQKHYAHHVWSELDAEKMLKAIEEIGMLPPSALIANSPYPKGHKYYGENEVLENQWEPEDEK